MTRFREVYGEAAGSDLGYSKAANPRGLRRDARVPHLSWAIKRAALCGAALSLSEFSLESELAVKLNDSARHCRTYKRAVGARRRLDGGRGDARSCGIPDIMIRVAEVGVIEHVVEVGSHTESKPFRELERLQHAEVTVEVMRPAEAVSSSLSERPIPNGWIHTYSRS